MLGTATLDRQNEKMNSTNSIDLLEITARFLQGSDYLAVDAAKDIAEAIEASKLLPASYANAFRDCYNDDQLICCFAGFVAYCNRHKIKVDRYTTSKKLKYFYELP